MDTNEHTKPENLVKYAFYWSVARMAVTGFFLIFGSVGFVRSIFFGSMGMLNIYQIFWLVSGVTSVYLIYAWHKSDRSIFGGKEMKDKIAFWAMIVTGINQGLIAFGSSFQTSFLYSSGGNVVFWILGAAYLVLAYYMWKRWNDTSGGLFGVAVESPDTSVDDENEQPLAPQNDQNNTPSNI